MIVTTANCPSCGGPIAFKVGSSITVVCEFCGSAVARTDRDLRNLGKVSDLIDTQSPLRVGLEGRYDGQPFVLTGRVQIRHQAGGVWDEWYASFGGNGWGWLAEAQGKFTMTFYRQVPDPRVLPPPNFLQPGQPIAIPGDTTQYVVAETGVGCLTSGQGEIPYAVQPGLTYGFADLSGPSGAFATLDYRSTPPTVFAGREVTLGELGISPVVDSFDAESRRVDVVRLACPKCGAPVDLRAPDSSLRATCPSCSALLDVDHGNLTYLRTLEAPRPQRFPNGAEAIVDGVSLTLVGFMVRGCQVDGEWFYWEEYLLYNPAVGYRWIVNGETGWFFVEPAAPGDVRPQGVTVRYHGKRFLKRESVVASVAYVRGEFYWRVEVGERATATDYMSRAETLSQEISGSEVNWSFGRPIDPEALDRAFDPRMGRAHPVVLPPPRVYVPPKPLPSMWTALGVWLALTVLAFAAAFLFTLTASNRTLLSQSASFDAEATPDRPPAPAGADDETGVSWMPTLTERTVVLGSFAIDDGSNVEASVVCTPSGGSDVYLKLVNDGSGEVQTESVDASYGGRWSRTFASPGPGNYTLYAIRRASEGATPESVLVELKAGVADFGWPVLVSFLLFGGPVLLALMKVIRALFTE